MFAPARVSFARSPFFEVKRFSRFYMDMIRSEASDCDLQITIWHVETEINFSSRRAILYSTRAEQIERQIGCDIFRNEASLERGFSKISRDPAHGSLF